MYSDHLRLPFQDLTVSKMEKYLYSHWNIHSKLQPLPVPEKSLVANNIISQPAMSLHFTKARDRQSHLFLWIFINHPPPPITLTMFAAYIVLSRSQGRDTIQLLGDFDNTLFTTHPLEDLRQEDVQLAVLTKITKAIWDQTSVLAYDHYTVGFDFNFLG